MQNRQTRPAGPGIAAVRYRPAVRAAGLLALMLSVVAAGCRTVAAQTSMARAPDSGATNAPDLSIGADQYPDDDAIILRWEQHWTLETDGTVRRRDHRWIKLLNSRPIRRTADPRIDFCEGQDRVTIHAARTHLPDGTILPVPDYSFNEAGPDDVAGWPEYIGWKQTVVSFSGVQDNAVLELDYEIVTQPGVLQWIDADLRLHDDYPTVERVVSVTVPDDVALHHRVDGITPAPQAARRSADGATTYRWSFKDLAGAPVEPQSLPWQRRCGRLRFTTCRSATDWVTAMLKQVAQAAEPGDAIRTFAQDAIESETDPAEQVRAIAGKLGDSFNFVNSPKTMRPLRCRSAADVLRANYGNPLESASLCLAALRSLGMNAAPAVAVDARFWDEAVPTGSGFAGVVVVVDGPDGPIHVHPQHGVFRSPGGWGRHWLLSVDASGGLSKTYVQARGETRASELHVTGKITITDDAKAEGELRIRLTGAFYDPAKLETSDSQEGLVKGIAGRVLSDFTVADHSVAVLSDVAFKATAQVASKDMLTKAGEKHVLRFGDGPAFLADFPMPLDRSVRRTDVHLPGAFREQVNLTIELPEGWTLSIVPASPAAVEGDWGIIRQTVELDGQTLRFRRTVAVNTDTLAPDSFAVVRDAINHLRTDRSLLLACSQ